VHPGLEISRRLFVAIGVVVLLVLALAAAGTNLAKHSHNEQMYVVGGLFVAEGKALYRDFAFLQAPNTALAYGALFSLTGADGAYLAAKLFNLAALLAAALAVYLIAVGSSGRRGLGVLAAGLFLANPIVVRAAAEASNYAAPIAASFFATYFLLAAEKSESRLAYFAAGSLFALAAGFKAYYVVVVVATVATLLGRRLAAGSRAPDRAALAWLAAGALVGGLPVLWLAAADWDRFYFNNLTYHLLNVEYRSFHRGYVPSQKWSLFLQRLGARENLLMLATLGALVATLWRRPACRRAAKAELILFALVAAGWWTAAIPSPSWTPYYAVPASLTVLVLTIVAASVARSSPRLAAGALAMLLALQLATGHDRILQGVTSLSTPERWTSTRFARQAEEVRVALGATRSEVWGASLHPLVLWLAGARIHPEFATGSFLYRVGDQLSEEQRRTYVTTSPERIVGFLDGRKPGLIFVGREKHLDGKLIAYAESRGYRPLPIGRQSSLYLAPTLAPASP